MTPKITIIGAGFAALTAIKQIRKQNKEIEITVISPKAEFIYLPSLIWIPSGRRTADDLRIDLTSFFKKCHVKHHAGLVTAIKDGGRTVVTDNKDAPEVTNDALLIASGGRFIKKLSGIEHAITICEGIESAEKMRDQIKAMDGGIIALGFGGNPKEPAAMRGGPMFELLFGLDTQLKQENRRDKFKLIFFSPAKKPGAKLGEGAVKGIMKEIAKRGIETHLGHKMKSFSSEDSGYKVTTEGGEFNTDMIIFMPGMTGPSFAANTEMPLSAGGLIQSNMHCQIEGFDHCYVAGDAGSFPGPDWKPKQAHMADLQAVAATKNMLDELNGKAASHTFKYELVCIIDSNTKGILAFRNEKRTFIIPPLRLLHTCKKCFEWLYLRSYKKCG